MAGDGEIACPCCSGRKPALRDLDALLIALLIALMDERGLSEDAQSVLEAVYLAEGRPVTAERIFDRMYEDDPDGGPPPARAYADLRAALAELDTALQGTGLGIVRQGRRDGWRLVMDMGGAYVAA